MSSNVGLSTPRGSGTSGYVQRNLSALRNPQSTFPSENNTSQSRPPKPRTPDPQILTHDRLREIELQVLEHRDTLETAAETDDTLTDDLIDEKCEGLRRKLTDEMERRRAGGGGGGGGSKSGVATGRVTKRYQVHELAEAKIRESERLRRALGLRGDEALEGAEHPMARQGRRRREREEDRERRVGDGERDVEVGVGEGR